MNIEMIESPADTASVDLMAQLETLGDAKNTLHQMSLLIIATLASKTGTAVLMVDVLGNGGAQIIAAGNPALVPPLLSAAGEAGAAMFNKPESSALQ